MPRLIYGDAIIKDGNKYATNFIVLRLCDKQVMETKFAPLVGGIADYFTDLFSKQAENIAKMDFYGSDFGMSRLGYIALPAILRSKVRKIKDSLNLPNGPYPPRQDGGYGWFIISEQPALPEMGMCACNEYSDDDKNPCHCLYYYNLDRFFSDRVNDACDWITCEMRIAQTQNGTVSGELSEEHNIKLLEANLIIKDGEQYKFNFAMFSKEQFENFRACFEQDNAELEKMLSDLITDIHKSFKAFVPKRLDNQINQWISCYVHNIIGFVAEELIERDVLEKPDDEKPLTNGVFSSGKDVSV
jgi:hypothetical protein